LNAVHPSDISKNPAMENATGLESVDLAVFAATPGYEDIPPEVIERTLDFFVDRVCAALSGAGQRAIAILERFAVVMGPRMDARKKNPGVAKIDLAVIRGNHQRRRLAYFRAGRRSQRLLVSPGSLGVPARARGRPPSRRHGPRSHYGVGRRIRGRHTGR
jgi:hypothetical protein